MTIICDNQVVRHIIHIQNFTKELNTLR